MLAAREDRTRGQADLLAGAPAVVSLTVVSPGPVKRSATIERLFGAAATALTVELIANGWSEAGRIERHGETGPELLVAVRGPVPDVKRAMVALEETRPWGRLWDLDVVTTDGPLSRADAGGPARRCLVCSEPAAGCARSRRHDAAEVMAAVEAIVRGPVGRAATTELPTRSGSRARTLGALAAEALRTEARLAPKPGLVDAHNSGSHDDMTLAHFLASADALQPWFERMADLGATPGWTVPDLRDLGRAAERDMLDVTGGVNTHRGAIYALGWLCAVAGGAPSAGEAAPAASESCRAGHLLGDADLLGDRVGALSAPLLRAWIDADHPDPSHGRRAFDAHGLLGARGEAASGFRLVRRHALSRVRTLLGRGWAEDDALLSGLVTLMARLDDTNLVSRGGIAALRAAQEWAGSLEAADLDPEELRSALADADFTFSARRWSPGGSADLLSATWFLAQLEPRQPPATSEEP